MIHHVYIFWADKEPLYVGVTNDLPRRMKQHHRTPWSKRATHISVVPFEDRTEATAGEVECIWSLRPTYNVRDNPRQLPLVSAMDSVQWDPEWLAEQDVLAAAAISRFLSGESIADRKRDALTILRSKRFAA